MTKQIEPILQKALTSSKIANALDIYIKDRNTAISWYWQQGFPNHDPESEIGRRVLKTLALEASKQGIWREAWAGFHIVLAAKIPSRSNQDVAEMCWEIGRAHLGIHVYELANLYLKCAEILAKHHPSPGFRLHVIAERGVLDLLSGPTKRYQMTIDEVSKDRSSAEQIAALAYKAGIKNARWADEQGRRFPESLKLADAQFRMSLDLNKRLGVSQAVGAILCQLGDVHKHMGKRQQARELYEESLSVFTRMGNVSECAEIRERLRDL